MLSSLPSPILHARPGWQRCLFPQHPEFHLFHLHAASTVLIRCPDTSRVYFKLNHAGSICAPATGCWLLKVNAVVGPSCSIQKLAVLKSSFILDKPSGNYSPHPAGSVNSFSAISPRCMDQQSRLVLITAMQKIKHVPCPAHKRHRGGYGKRENSITAWRQEMC